MKNNERKHGTYQNSTHQTWGELVEKGIQHYATWKRLFIGTASEVL